jgi:hypothetical protein
MKPPKLLFVAGLSILGFFVSQTISMAATITGKALFEGTSPAPTMLKADADPTCQALHPDGISDDAVIVNANGTLKNVFVYVKEGVSGTFEAPKEPVIFDQKGCLYTPKVFGIQVKQPLEILNSDNTLHNVHALAKNNKEFNLGMPIQGMKLKKSFDKPEIMVKFKCEVHPWMAAYAGILEHPFFGVTGDEGTFEIKDLPPGQYVLEAWHEKYGVLTQNITIAGEGDTQETSFQFKG